MQSAGAHIPIIPQPRARASSSRHQMCLQRRPQPLHAPLQRAHPPAQRRRVVAAAHARSRRLQPAGARARCRVRRAHPSLTATRGPGSGPGSELAHGNGSAPSRATQRRRPLPSSPAPCRPAPRARVTRTWQRAGHAMPSAAGPSPGRGPAGRRVCGAAEGRMSTLRHPTAGSLSTSSAS